MSARQNPFWFEYAQLAKLARHLLTQREAAYPKMVIAGKMTKEAASTGIHNMSAAAQLMHAMIGYSEIGKLPADRWAIHDDLSAAARRARQMADKNPKSEAHQDTADGVEAIAHWLQPWDHKTRHANISLAQHIHGLNIDLREQARQESREAA